VVQVTKATGDHLRANILRVLAQDSFAVLELGEIFKMAQPAMSHHLKLLHQAGLVDKRKEGTSVFYRRAFALASLHSSIYACLDETPVSGTHKARIEFIYRQRLLRSKAFFANHAQALAQQKELICAPSVYVDAVLKTALQQCENQRLVALEVGPGNGTVLAALAPHFNQVVGVDNSSDMLDATHGAMRNLHNNIKLIERDFADLPRIRKYNLVVAAMVVHHMPSPKKFFQQAAGVLKKGGTLVVAELCAHSQDWVKETCGDVWLGFDTQELSVWSKQCGFKLTQQQFLAQKNGFRVQVNAYTLTK